MQEVWMEAVQPVLQDLPALATAGVLMVGMVSGPVLSQQPLEKIKERLQPCPETPNCVSTLAEDEEHAIAPIAYDLLLPEAKRCLQTALEQMSRMTVVTDEPDYLHVEFRSLIFRFVDDVLFAFDDTAKVIHFRSAARLGRGDYGVNRRRMEKIRRAFRDAMAQHHRENGPAAAITNAQEGVADRA